MRIKGIIAIFILSKSRKLVYKNIRYSISLLFAALFHTKIVPMGRNGEMAWKLIIRHWANGFGK